MSVLASGRGSRQGGGGFEAGVTTAVKWTTPAPRRQLTHWVHPEVTDYLSEFCDAGVPARQEPASGRSAGWPGARAGRDGLIVCMADSVDEAFLARCPRLRVVAATLKGYDNSTLKRAPAAGCG